MSPEEVVAVFGNIHPAHAMQCLWASAKSDATTPTRLIVAAWYAGNAVRACVGLFRRHAEQAAHRRSARRGRKAGANWVSIDWRDWAVGVEVMAAAQAAG